jgi:hypothetical protein
VAGNAILDVKLAGTGEGEILAVKITNPEDFGNMASGSALPTASETYRNIFFRRTSDNTVWYLNTLGTGWEQIDTTTSEVLSVNGQTGDVDLDAENVGADPAGTAAEAVSQHALDFDHSLIATALQKNGLIETTGDVVEVTGQIFSARVACTLAVDWNAGNIQSITLANGAQEFTFANPQDGARYRLILKQPATGAAGTVTWPAISWVNGTPPILTLVNGKVDIITLIYDAGAAVYYGNYSFNY